uniref:Ig-like domain-containing protein n=1 Tax=Cyprinus carpio TaxID=7962 RepID=A0A8C1QFZ2_CYPCA
VYFPHSLLPNQPSVVLAEGSSTTLSCTYDGSAYSLHWYRQKPGSKPEFLLLIVESSKYVTKADQPHPHMSIRLHDNKSVDLEISSAAVSDSAVYYCALEPTVTEKTLYTLQKLVSCILYNNHIFRPSLMQCLIFVPPSSKGDIASILPEGGAPGSILVQSQFSCLKTEQTYIESVILRERTVSLDSQSHCLSLVQMLPLVFIIFSLLKGE